MNGGNSVYKLMKSDTLGKNTFKCIKKLYIYFHQAKDTVIDFLTKLVLSSQHGKQDNKSKTWEVVYFDISKVEESEKDKQLCCSSTNDENLY